MAEYEVSITRACRLMEIDFVSDVVESGRKFRVMNVLDDADRTVVAQEISMSMPAQRVVKLLDLLRIVT